MTNKQKRQYRIRNWHDYNKALISRGSLTLWIDSHSLNTWLDTDHPARRGQRRIYADVAIECALLLREAYHLPLRSAQGLVSSVMQLLNLDLPIPHYSTLSRRARPLTVPLAAQIGKGPLHLVIDSTGLKLYGEGEWRVRGRGWTKRRTWRKLHLAMDGETQQITSALITPKEVVDPRALPRLLKQVEGQIERVTADGAYDSRQCYKAIHERGAQAIIPPRQGSTLWEDEYLRDRNENLRGVRRHGVKGWKKRSGYHRRSLVETAMCRLKTIFADKLRSRRVERQATEVADQMYGLESDDATWNAGELSKLKAGMCWANSIPPYLCNNAQGGLELLPSPITNVRLPHVPYIAPSPAAAIRNRGRRRGLQ